ncbi:MAG TPA: dolichyl-phosphate beta-glucosyltransferase, partial [Kofleriaceae bacterium]|nr:dolichyl-phosphate beta-glucosyltransferase [Kofleriaceae bacterium]
KLSIVIPAYNESARLGPTLQSALAFCQARGTGFEIVVVDDGSTDDTAAIARGFESVRVIELGKNRGKGAAVRTGMLAATGDPILFADADQATPFAELEKLEEKLADGYDIAIASRALPSSDIRVRQHRARELMGRTFNAMIRVAGLSGIRDTQCGFKLFSRDAAQYVFGRATIDGFAFDVEVLILAGGRYRIAEVPVTWRHVEASKVSPGIDALRMLRDLIGIRWRHRRRFGASP